MILALHGLRFTVRDVPSGVVADDTGLWQRTRVAKICGPLFDDLPADISIRGAAGHGGTWTHHIFRFQDRVNCHFAVAPDGRTVMSYAIPGIHHTDLLSLFSEPVMRTLLFRQGLVSFHAAALVKHGRAILLMGPKGAGKSTLSLGMRKIGWSLLADDLVRLAEVGGEWRAFAGCRLSKLNRDVLLAWGHSPDDLPGRWRDPAYARADSATGKRMIPAVGNAIHGNSSFAVRAVFALQARAMHLPAARCRPLEPILAVRALTDNATPDPLALRPVASRLYEGAIGGLLRQAKIRGLTLPDRLDAVAIAAQQLETVVANET